MNERIKQLLYETRIYDGRCGETQGIMTCAKTLNEFAQSIVKECVNAVMDGTKEGDHYAQRIEQHFDNGPGGILHFGVEE